VLNTATLLLVRSYVVDTLGVEANGVYQVLLGIPAQTLVVVLNTLSVYAFPLVSGLRELADVRDALNLTLRFTLLSATPLIVGLILLSAPLIRILYSSQFLAAAQLLPIQLLGDYFKTLAWGLGLSLLGRGHLVAFTLLDLVWDVAFATGVVVLTPRLGLAGTAASYAVAYLLHALATYTYQHRREGVRLAAPNMRLLVASTVLLAGAVGIAEGSRFEVQLAYSALGLVAWAWIGTQRSEWLAAWRATTGWVRPVLSTQ
jgi:PST family polysaccharide transporter